MKCNTVRPAFCIALAVMLVTLTGCINSRKPIDKMVEQRTLYEATKSEYQPIIKIVESIQQSKDAFDTKEKVKHAREYIVLKADQYGREHTTWMPFAAKYLNYPFHQYLVILDDNSAKLNKVYGQLPWKTEAFAQQVRELLGKLENVRRYLVTHSEYLREKRLMELKKKGHEESNLSA